MVERTPRKFFWLKTSLVLFVLVGVGGFFAFRPEPPLEVEVMRVEKGEVREMVVSSAAGEVKPFRRVVVRSEISGTVAVSPKNRGDRVKGGEQIVAFAAAELNARISQAQANLEAAKVAVRIAQTRQGTAKRALERAKKLHARQAISNVDLERAQTEHKAVSQAVEQARATQGQAAAALKLVRVTYDRATVEAPFSGVLQEVFAEVGVQLSLGSPLFDVIDDASLRVEVPVDESDIARIFIGQVVTLRAGSRRGVSFVGKVSFIPPAVGKSKESGPLTASVVGQKDRSFYVHVIPDDQSQFRIGTSVNAEFLVSARKDVLFVPTHVVLGRGSDRAVYLVKKGKATKHPFEPGLTSWERTEVLSGLDNGTVVISSLDVDGLEEGARVQIAGAQPESKGEGTDLKAEAP